MISGTNPQGLRSLPSRTRPDQDPSPSGQDKDLVNAESPPDLTLFYTYLQAMFAWAMAQPGDDQAFSQSAQMQAVSVMTPQDPLESAMIYQMIACNHQVMTLLGKAQRATFSDSARDWLNLASRFMATYAKQMEALTKYQRKGKQTVVVEYLNAAAGSQVMVGNVETGRGQGR